MANKYENGIFGFIPQDEWLDVGFNVTRQNDPIDGLFGDEKTNNITARWQTIESEYQIPVMAQFHGFDTEANTTFRIPIDNHSIEKGLIKVKLNQSERMRELTKSGVTNSEMYDYVLNDGIRLAEQVFTRSKVAKNELMASGKVTIKENNLDLTVDYGVPQAQLAYTFDLSSTADISAQIQEVVDDAANIGVTITGMLTSKKNITKMRRNAGLQKEINSNVGVGQLIRSSSLYAYLEEEFGISNIVTNDLTYAASTTIGSNGRPSISTARYFPADTITFFATTPSGLMGTGLWGDPPEVTLGAQSFGNVEGSISPYVYVSQWVENDPAVLWTKASGLFMPVLYNPNALFIAKTAGVTISRTTASVAEGATVALTATTTPSGGTITWASSDDTVATVSNGTVTGVSAGTATITASATIDGVTYSDTCIVTVSGA